MFSIDDTSPLSPAKGMPPAMAHVDRAAQNTDDILSHRRTIPRDVSQTLKDWLAQRPGSFSSQVTLAGYSLSAATEGIDDPARSWLLVDMARCIATLAGLARTNQFKVTFGPVYGNQCRKFHTDHVRYRLVSTYLGAGTQWVSPQNVREDSPMLAGESPEEANRRVVRDLAAVHHAAPGEVLYMRGARHECAPTTLHRSPPIENSGAGRVVLIVTTVHD